MPLFIPITKVDVAQRLVYGTLSEELPDKTGEILDYQTAKPAFQEWSGQFHAASNGKSLGNVRAMHGAVAAGKLTDIAYDDEKKRIEGVAKIVDDDEWRKVVEGVYTGFSIGGGYARRWPDPENPQLMRYTPTLSEVSLVDNPALSSATFDVIKQDGTIECRKFHSRNEEVHMKSKAAKSDTKAATAQKELPDIEESEFSVADIMDLLDDLAWLEDCAREDDNAEIVACVTTLQEYLCDEYGIEASDDTEPSEADGMDDTQMSSKQYVAELAQTGQNTDGRPRYASGKAMRVTRAQTSQVSARKFARMAIAVEKMQKRLAQLETLPLPAKGMMRAISKSDDGQPNEYLFTQQAKPEKLDKLSPAERARELMKIALANPMGM